MVSLVDTNILVYCFDPHAPEKRRIAIELLDAGIANQSVRIPHQALIEFVAAVTRVRPSGRPLLEAFDARREAEELLTEFVILYPNDLLFRTAIRGAAAYRLSWFDAHLWAYAEHYGLDEIISEDFEHGRFYGRVQVRNPFVQ